MMANLRPAYLKLPFTFNLGKLQQDLQNISKEDWIPHFNTNAYENGWHWLLRDNQREVVYVDILAFIDDPRGPLPSQAPPLLPTIQANR